MINRREFLGIIGGVTVVSLSGCGPGPARRSTATTAPSAPGTSPPSDSASTGSSPTTALEPSVSAGSPAHRRVLVIVQLNGGNDGLNTLIPAAGQYHDARPTLAIPEADRIILSGRTDFAMHPSLAPLAPLWAADKLSFVEAIGFPDQDHSHFVAMDQWWRADNLEATQGWLGSYLASLPTTDPLYATALNNSAPQLMNPKNQASVIFRANNFRFNKAYGDQLLSTLTSPASVDPLQAAAQLALARSIGAVNSFTQVMTAAAADNASPAEQQREGGVTLSDGLATASKLIINHPQTRIVVVSAGGFDTHANQLGTQKDLLADLAGGLKTFMTDIDKAGMADDVLVVTTSEFGRRVAENGSGGTDHGTGNVSFVLGSKIMPGIHGELDMTNLLNGDVRPTVDPRTIYTACLDWIGADPVAVLGKRFDDVKLVNAA